MYFSFSPTAAALHFHIVLIILIVFSKYRIIVVKELSRHCLDVICKLHIRSSIDYCITVFGPSLNQLQIQKLDTLLYRAAKIVTGAQKFTSKSASLWSKGGKTPIKELSICV